MSWGLPRGQLPEVEIVCEDNCLGSNCPRWQLSVGQLSRGQLSRENCPRTENKLWCINVVLLIVDQIMLGKNEESLLKIWIKFVNRKD